MKDVGLHVYENYSKDYLKNLKYIKPLKLLALLFFVFGIFVSTHACQ